MTHFTPKITKKASLLAIIALICTFFAIFSIIACNKMSAENSISVSCNTKPNFTKDANEAQRTAMIAFCTTNNINYTVDSSGVFYQIITPGASTKVNLCETLSITYTGKLLNGTQFDAGTIAYDLSSLIVGWQIVVPYIGKGGHIKILIPSSLGYGSVAQTKIPANSPLYFDIILN